MERPKAPSEARSAEGVRYCPRKIFKFNVQIYAFSCYFCVKQYAESNDVLPLQYRVGNRYSVFSIFLVGICTAEFSSCTSTRISYWCL